MRVTETLTSYEFIPRVRELQEQGAAYWTVKVLNGGYEISYVISDPKYPSSLFQADLPISPQA